MITSIVQEISNEVKKIKKEILINIHAVPWREKDFDNAVIKIARQDFKALIEYVNYIFPMCYSLILQRGTQWIGLFTRNIFNYSNSNIIPSIEVIKSSRVFLKEKK